MKPLCTILFLLAASAFATAQTQRDDLTPLEIAYTTTVSAGRESFLVDLDVANVKRPIVHVAMPTWTPGSYGIGNYGEAVADLTATSSEGRALDVLRIDPLTWSIDTAGVRALRVSYAVPSVNRRFGRAADPDAAVTGLQIRGPSTYLYVRGAKATPVSSRYKVPAGWKVANGLLQSADPMVRRARDYDTFIDAPTILGEYEERVFDVQGTPFHCVFFENSQEYDFDLDAFTAIVERIVVNIGQLYGSYPFPDYWFLFTLPGGGGLEHLNSTSIGLSGPRQKTDPEAGASVTSHEFFHAWNVKRIRPVTLGPFEYQHENYTGNLWVSEGWTSYFGDLTLARIGVLSREEYLTHLAGIISREQSKPRRLEHSVYWASRNVWHRDPNEDGPRVDYYGKGELLGMLLDLEIRHRTGNTKSLNDVMRFLNRWFAERGVGFEEGDVERACTAISNHDFAEFFARHVYGTSDPDFGSAFAYAGIDYHPDVIACSFPFALRGNRVSGRFTPENAEIAGPRPGEVVVSLDGVAFENGNDFLRAHRPGDKVLLTLTNPDGEREVEVTLTDDTILIASLSFRDDVTPMQEQIRESWLTSSY